MTLDELRAQLDALNLPGPTLVVLAKDAEGNRFSPLSEAEGAMYLADPPHGDAVVSYLGEHYMTDAERLALDDPDDYSPAPDDAVAAVFLWPAN